MIEMAQERPPERSSGGAKRARAPEPRTVANSSSVSFFDSLFGGGGRPTPPRRVR
jgi:hypothetical protein